MGTVNPTRALTTISPAALEETIKALHGHLAEVEGQPNRYCVPLDKAPSTLERRQLSAACERLVALLEPCLDKLVIEAVISQFLIPYDTAREADAVSTEARNERFVKAVFGLPLGAIRAAVDRYDSASTILTSNPSFRPKPAEFAAEVKAGLTPLRTKLVHVRRILNARVDNPVSEEQLAQVQQIAKDYLANRGFPGERRAGHDARDALPLPVLETVRPITGDISHLMSNLDRRRATA